MKENLPQRKEIRLKYYDYSLEGYYFITICTKNRECNLSKIIPGVCRGGVPPPPENTKIGNEIIKSFNFIINKYKCIEINDYVIMLNHIHLIIEKTGGGGTPPLHRIIQEIKSFTTKRYNQMNNVQGIKLWQRNYYEHVIRNEKEYLIIK